jgi:iron complex outermembrane recepter protein
VRTTRANRAAPLWGTITMTLRMLLLAAVAGGPMLIAAPAALAQEEAAGPRRVETVTVTARRIEENVQSTPVAVTAISAAQLEAAGPTNASVLQGAVPNLNIVQGRGSGSSANVFIRGVGQPDALATFDPAVGIYVDDVYYSRIRGALLDIFDVERIEVLRGPQGTLYGKNTIGGALKVISKKPDDTFRASIRAGYGDYNAFDVNARVSGPLVEGVLAGGLSLYRGTRDGFVTDPVNPSREYNNKDTSAARAQLSWTVNDALKIDISADYTEENPAMTVGRQENLLFATAFVVAGAIPLSTVPPGEYNFRTTTTPSLPNSQDLTHTGVSVAATWDMTDSLTLKSISAYRELTSDDYIDIDATRFELGDVFVGVEQDQVSQEFQLAYDEGGRIAAVGGLYLLQENIKSNQIAFGDDIFVLRLSPTLSLPVTFERFIRDSLNTYSYAAFGQVDFRLSDKLKLTAGLRYTEETKHYNRATWTRSNQAFLDSGRTPALNFAFNRTVSFDDTSPMVSIDYQASDAVFLFARVSRGFKSGGINGRANGAGQEAPYAPEEATTFEAGVKSDWLDGRLRANATFFVNDYKNFQARVSQPDLAQLAVLNVLNAGKMETSGVELELTAQPNDALTLDAQIGWLDADYKEFRDRRAVNGDRSWQRPAFSPEWTARYAAAYRIDLAETGAITLGADASFRSEMALAVDNSLITAAGFINGLPAVFGQRFPGMWQGDYWLYNARIVWTSADERFTAGLYGKNLTDEVYKTDAQEFSDIAGIQTAYYGAPRTWQFVVSAKY